MDKRNIYRIAAMLYVNDNGSLKRETAIKKVLENVIVELENKPSTAQQIEIAVKEKYDLIIVEDEIKEIVTNPKNKHFQIDYANQELLINLKEERMNNLYNQNSKNLEYYIDKFIAENNYSSKEKDSINRYIYKIFDNNLAEFVSIFAKENEISENISDSIPEDSLAIKQFIEWPNVEKNKMLSSISNYALEYTFLTGKGTEIGQRNAKNIFSSKKIYLDTNIIFYCLGINGEDYAKTNRIFLKKCCDSKSSLHVSFYTNLELENTLNHVVNELEKFTSPSIFKHEIQKGICDKDIYNFYLKWASNKRTLRDPKYFKAYIKDEYEKLIREFNISRELAKPFSNDEVNSNEIIERYSQEIFCGTSSINYDALNVYYVESKREKGESDIISTQYIFVSADNSLLRWDQDRKNVSVVISPSAWLTIMARLLGRTDNDYECFVNFINLKGNDSTINNKEYFQIVQTLSEMVEDIETQETIIDVMIAENFDFLKSEEKRTPEFIRQETQIEVNKIVDNKLKNLQTKNEILRLKVDENEKTIFKQSDLLKKQNQEIEKQKSENVKDSEYLTHISKELERTVLARKKWMHATIVLLISIPIIVEIMVIFVYKVQNPLSFRLYELIVKNSIYEPQGIDGYFKVVHLVLTILVTVIDYNLLKVFWHDGTKKKVIEAYYEEQKGISLD